MSESQTVMYFNLQPGKQEPWMSVNGKPIGVELVNNLPVMMYQCEAAPLLTKPREIRVIGIGQTVPGDRGLEYAGYCPDPAGGLYHVWIGPPQMDAVLEE